MFHTLLVPLDGTPEAAVALPPARALAAATGGSITLLRVVREAADLAEAQAYLARVARELEGAGLRLATAVRVGDTADEIAAEARERHADLLVMARRGAPGRAVPVSVTGRVLAELPLPMLLVRPGRRRVTRLRTLLVPVDGTPGGALALAAASGLARPTDARIVLLQVVAPLPAYVYDWLPGASVGGFVDPRWDEAARLSAERYVALLVETRLQAGLRAEGRVVLGVFGTVAETIARVADEVDADLVVMSTHGLAGPIRSVLGSVAEAVVEAAEQPVLLVRRERMVDRGGAPASRQPALAMG